MGNKKDVKNKWRERYDDLLSLWYQNEGELGHEWREWVMRERKREVNKISDGEMLKPFKKNEIKWKVLKAQKKIKGGRLVS